jgi:hypothetical protein
MATPARARGASLYLGADRHGVSRDGEAGPGRWSDACMDPLIARSRERRARRTWRDPGGCWSVSAIGIVGLRMRSSCPWKRSGSALVLLRGLDDELVWCGTVDAELGRRGHAGVVRSRLESTRPAVHLGRMDRQVRFSCFNPRH